MEGTQPEAEQGNGEAYGNHDPDAQTLPTTLVDEVHG